MKTFREFLNEKKAKSAYDAFIAKKLESKGYSCIDDIPTDKVGDFWNEVELEWNSKDEPGKDGEINKD